MPITGDEQPISPQIDRQSNGNIVRKRVLTYDRGYDWEAEMPSPGDVDATYGTFRNAQGKPRGVYIDVTLTYDSLGLAVNFAPGDGDEEFFARTQNAETPIELNDGYRTKWNYGVYYKNLGVARTIAADFPGGQAAYDAATDLSDLNGTTLVWAKSHPGPQWVKITDPTKPGLDSFLRANTVVTRKTWHATQVAAEADLAAINTRVAPAETFSASPATANYWLVVNIDTEHDGEYWVATSEYLHAKQGWDTEVYP